MLSIKKEKPNSSLDRFRKRRLRWWVALPLLALIGVLSWYAITVFQAYRNATADNVGGGSVLLGDNSKTKGQTKTTERINILLVGIGGATHPGGNLADSIMVASIDPKTKSVALLSLPRDLYVNLPSGAKDKINAVHAQGESNGTKGGGPALLKQVVSDNLGVPVHYFIRVDFEGFKKIVDTMGGISINVKTPLNDPYFPDAQMKGYEPFKVAAGVQKMDGATALKYSRSRETTSDFDRARRQQEVLVAIKDKALSAQVLANPAKVTNIITILGKHILTDFSASEIDQFVALAKGFNNPQIKTQVLGSSENGLVIGGRSPAGASIQVPRAGAGDFTEIQAFTRAYFASSAIETEKPTILLQNGGATKSTLTTLEKQLQWAGYKVQVNETASATETKTVVYDYTDSKKPLSAAYLKERYELSIQTKNATEASPATQDFTFVVGSDFSKTTLVPKPLKEAKAEGTSAKPLSNL